MTSSLLPKLAHSRTANPKRWAMEQDFHGDLQVNLAWFFAFFFGVLE